MDVIHEEIESMFRGYIVLSLAQIDFDSGRELQPDIVRRLRERFALQGCQRHNTENAIPAIVEPELLRDSYLSIGVASIPLSVSHAIALGVVSCDPVVCLHGKHRIHAARSLLFRDDAWWVVKVFDPGELAPPSLVDSSADAS